ncbi:hypothetical protein ACHAPT_008689 [Fusarium lateritium]
MEAAGLAIGVVGLGLQLATTLQTYVEGVAGAEDRLRELSFDVASTASTLKQLEDMLDADKAVVENTNSDQTVDSVTIFTDQGRRDIYSLSRRCEKVYQGIVRVILNVSAPPSARSKAIAANVGISDLTATRLMQFGRSLKWPWVEPRVKACQEELRWLKMDLLLHLQVATVARIHLKASSKQDANPDDESTIEGVAERLIARRAVYRKAALEGRRQRKGLTITAGNEATREPLLAAKTGKKPESTDDAFDIEAWTLTFPEVDSRQLPFGREAIVQRIQKTTENGRVSAWDQFLALTPQQRDQAQAVVAQAGEDDARARSYLALETRENDEIIVFVAVGEHEEVVYLTDPDGRTWHFPYKDFNHWAAAKRQIRLLQTKDASLQHEITQGRFDVRAESGSLIPPALWEKFVKPGGKLEMVLWSDTAPQASLGKLAKRLFHVGRRRATQRRPRRRRTMDIFQGSNHHSMKQMATIKLTAQDPYDDKAAGLEYVDPDDIVPSDAGVSNLFFSPTAGRTPSSQNYEPSNKPTSGGQDQPPDHRRGLSGESFPNALSIDLNNAEMEADGEDLLDFDYGEEGEDIDMADDFGELLAKWTNAERR